MYCEEHLERSNQLYTKYKEVNQIAITLFNDESLDTTIQLRELYASEFLDYEDHGAHSEYIRILKSVRDSPFHARRTTYNNMMSESRYCVNFIKV